MWNKLQKWIFGTPKPTPKVDAYYSHEAWDLYVTLEEELDWLLSEHLKLKAKNPEENLEPKEITPDEVRTAFVYACLQFADKHCQNITGQIHNVRL